MVQVQLEVPLVPLLIWEAMGGHPRGSVGSSWDLRLPSTSGRNLRALSCSLAEVEMCTIPSCLTAGMIGKRAKADGNDGNDGNDGMIDALLFECIGKPWKTSVNIVKCKSRGRGCLLWLHGLSQHDIHEIGKRADHPRVFGICRN